MRPRPPLHHLAALGLVACAASDLPPPPRPDVAARSIIAPREVAVAPPVAPPLPVPPPLASAPLPADMPPPAVPAPGADGAAGAPILDRHCASVPPLGPDGAAPSPPPHLPLGQDVPIPGDRAAYVLPGNDGDPRVIVYLHGMCGDVTAPDHFREALRERGTLLALRGDTPCANERFKWRDDSARIHDRIRLALRHLVEVRGLSLSLEGVILFGYSQGADRAEKLAQRYPRLFPRVVLGGPPLPASPLKLGRAQRVAILGGELETTAKMRAGADALGAAGIFTRYFMLECAYHGWYGTRPEQQLREVLDWVGAP